MFRLVQRGEWRVRIQVINESDMNETSRAKGQDTMSKMAAYSAGQRRRTTVGPATRVPIADFLVSNGYVPMTSSRASQARDRKQRNGVDAGTSDLLNTIQDRTQTSGEGELISVLNPSMQSIDGLPHFGSMVLSYQSSAPEDQGHIAQPGDSHVISDSDNLMSAQGRKTPVDIKPDLSPAPFANMQLLNSIEGDGSEASQICALRSEVFELRSIVQSLQDHETVFSKAVVNNSHPGLATSNFRTAELSRHVGQLEGMVRAIQPSMTVAEEHIEVLEGIVQELTKKSGDGCDAEKAKMCETVRSLKEAMSNLANLSKMLASVNASPTQASPSSTCI